MNNEYSTNRVSENSQNSRENSERRHEKKTYV